MTPLSASLERRIEHLERRVRRSQLVAAAAAAIAAGVCLVAAAAPPGVLRARGVVIVDERGTERIIMGAPMPSPPGEGARIMPATGMLIADHAGRERWGVGVYPTGQMTMGFDAAPGQGSGGNRERLHLGVEPDGTSFIRFLNQRSGLAGRLILTEKDRMALEFWDQKERVAQRATVDVNGWRREADYPLPRQAWTK